MMPVLFSLLSLRSSFRARASLQLEILAPRHQLLILGRANRKQRLELSAADRTLWVWLSRFWPGWRSALLIVKPETVIAWHRKGFRLYWTWKSRVPNRRPAVPQEIRDLIRRMSLANPRWGAPRIHGELLKLGIEVSQGTVAKYIVRLRRPPSQTWKTFLKNHAKDLASTDFFVVPTVTSQGSRLDGHSRGIDGSPIALAELLRGAADWLHSTRVSRPRDRPQRGRPATGSKNLFRLLGRSRTHLALGKHAPAHRA